MTHQHEIDQKAFDDVFGYRKNQNLTEQDTLLRVARMDAWNEALRWERNRPEAKQHDKILTIREELLKDKTALDTMRDRMINHINGLYKLTRAELGVDQPAMTARDAGGLCPRTLWTFTGESCPECGSRMIRNSKREECGELNCEYVKKHL